MMMSRKDMELRDWYAGLAMQTLLGMVEGTQIGERVAEEAFIMAEIMMDQREEVMEND
jgi:hypothetical protein